MRLRRVLSRMGLIVMSCCWVGCTVGPDYQPPTVDMPDQWHQQLVTGFMTEDSVPANWWELLSDPVLNELVREVRQNNPDLESAYWSLVQSRYARDDASGRYFPSIDAVGSYSRTRASDKGLMPLPKNPYNMHSVGFDTAWEIDIFGQYKRLIESAQASYESRIENYRDVLVSLSAEAASNYVQLRTVQARIQYAMKNIESQEGTLKLAQARFKSEIAPRLDVEQAKLNMADSQSQVPSLRSAEKAAINRLCVLTGKHPGDLYELLAEAKPIPMPPVEISIQVPADLLRQRPDIRKAERQLAAQSAQIGVATAELYPGFSLSGNIGFEAINFSEVTQNGSQYYGFAPSFRWRIFDGSRIRNQIHIEERKTEQLYWQYRSVVLAALEDVENAMTDYVQELQRKALLRQSVTAAKESVQLVTTQYKNGLTDFQNVLILQRSQFQQEDKLAQTEGQVVQNLIRIYKALGGWDDDVLPVSESDGQADKPSDREM